MAGFTPDLSPLDFQSESKGYRDNIEIRSTWPQCFSKMLYRIPQALSWRDFKLSSPGSHCLMLSRELHSLCADSTPSSRTSYITNTHCSGQPFAGSKLAYTLFPQVFRNQGGGTRSLSVLISLVIVGNVDNAAYLLVPMHQRFQSSYSLFSPHLFLGYTHHENRLIIVS